MINKIRQDYEISGSNETILSVIIGEEQAGWMAVFLDENFVTEGQTKIENFSLGTGIDLKSQVLKINTTVVDKNPNTNRTAVTYFLKGGKSPVSITSEVVVANDNDPALYDAKFKFV